MPFLIFLAILGLAVAAVSAFYMFAIGMSDSPGAGNPKAGCAFTVAGAVVFIGSIVAIIVRLF